MQIEVFDPAMCCSTGVCGPSVDPGLARFAADLDALASSGVAVRRFNLGQEPVAFTQNDRVRELLNTVGEAALPIVFTDGDLRSSGRFPARDELAEWTGTTFTAVATDAESVASSCCSTDDSDATCCSPAPVSIGTKSSSTTNCC